MKRAALVAIIVGGAIGIAACYPATTRPSTLPLPGAQFLEVELLVPDATRNFAVALDADSIPVARTEPKDGWLETDWFDAASLMPTSHRPVGMDVVKVRVWVHPARPNHSELTIETVYRPFADPSSPGRVLERQVSDSHPVAKRVAAVMAKFKAEFGGTDGQ